MRSFFICISALAFLASELIGLVQGLSTIPLITRSMVVFAVFFVLGHVLCMFWQQGETQESDLEAASLAPAAVQDAQDLTKKKAEVIKQAAGDPKQTAHVINTLISQ